MATWSKVGRESAGAARVLSHAGQERASVSRAYYAVYSELTHRLRAQGMKEFGRYDNPGHGKLPGLVRSSLNGLGPWDRQEAARAVRRLRTRRIEADYAPEITVDAATRRQVLRDLAYIEGVLGVAS